MIDVKLEVNGGKEFSTKLKVMPEKMNRSLTKAITILTIELKNYIVKDKLTNNVLNVRTGNLRRSIQQVVNSQPDNVTGEVFSAGDVKYAAIHEFGGTIKSRLGTGEGKPKPNGKATIVMPERSYMRSSLKEFQTRIQSRLSIAVNEGIK